VNLDADEIMCAVAETCGLERTEPATAEQVEALIRRLGVLHRAKLMRGDALHRALERERYRTQIRERVDGLAPVDAVQVVVIDAMWFDAPDVEIAELCGISADGVREHRRAFEGSTRVRAMVAHARAVANETGFDGRASDLVTLALAEYATRHQRPREAREGAEATTPATRPEERQSAPVPARGTTNDGGPSGQRDGRAPAMPGGTGRKAGASTSDASDGGRREADRSGLVRGSSHGDRIPGHSAPRRQIEISTPNASRQTASRMPGSP
jgi:hypothetical protein